MKNDKIRWIIGNEEIKACPLQPYSDVVVAFLDEVSGKLRKAAQKERMADVQSLAFWCRKGNIMKLKEQAGNIQSSLGRGIIFHVTPSNVPVNFAFSYFFGLLSGNANIVRLPSKTYRQVDIICDAVKQILEKPEYKILKTGTAFVQYGHEKEITDQFSALADGRIIWGGDAAIANIRQSPLKAKAVEVVFADRYSLGILDASAISNASEQELEQLGKDFYNDTYLMDQNACSTPHLLLWMDSSNNMDGNNHTTSSHKQSLAKERFWNAVLKEASKYDLEPIKAVDKYTDLCIFAMNEGLRMDKIQKYGNLLYTIDINELPEDISMLRGRFGMFYQSSLTDINQLAPHITSRVQSVLYYGMEQRKIFDFVLDNHLTGIDRIVPFGKSLDMNVYWDGYDIVAQLSRSIQVQ